MMSVYASGVTTASVGGLCVVTSQRARETNATEASGAFVAAVAAEKIDAGLRKALAGQTGGTVTRNRADSSAPQH
jgi:hypothetical protein